MKIQPEMWPLAERFVEAIEGIAANVDRILFSLNEINSNIPYLVAAKRRTEMPDMAFESNNNRNKRKVVGDRLSYFRSDDSASSGEIDKNSVTGEGEAADKDMQSIETQVQEVDNVNNPIDGTCNEPNDMQSIETQVQEVDNVNNPIDATCNEPNFFQIMVKGEPEYVEDLEGSSGEEFTESTVVAEQYGTGDSLEDNHADDVKYGEFLKEIKQEHISEEYVGETNYLQSPSNAVDVPHNLYDPSCSHHRGEISFSNNSLTAGNVPSLEDTLDYNFSRKRKSTNMGNEQLGISQCLINTRVKTELDDEFASEESGRDQMESDGESERRYVREEHRPAQEGQDSQRIVGQEFSSPDASTQHNEREIGNKKYCHCEACGKCFNNTSMLEMHRNSRVRGKIFKCCACEKLFTKKGNFGTHMRMHTGPYSFRCSTCGKTFTIKESLRRHMRLHTVEKPFRCSVCRKGFFSKGELNVHNRIHLGEKSLNFLRKGNGPSLENTVMNNSLKKLKITLTKIDNKQLRISQCSTDVEMRTKENDKIASEKSGREQMKSGGKCDDRHVQEGEASQARMGQRCSSPNTKTKQNKEGVKKKNPLCCEVCGKCFRNTSMLEMHRRNRKRRRMFKCCACERKCATKGNLGVHMRTHSGQRPFQCSTCGKCFTQKSSLITHERQHTGEKPFNCSVCQRGFPSKGQLTVHSRVHTGEKPFECVFCEKSFGQSSSLAAHVRIHTGERPYTCTICGKDFTHLGHIIRHNRTVHKTSFNAS